LDFKEGNRFVEDFKEGLRFAEDTSGQAFGNQHQIFNLGLNLKVSKGLIQFL
jgi:hypothetical protein